MTEANTVLVVDDDPDTRALLCDLLKGHGYQPMSCGNGKEALELLETGADPFVVLLDLSMPVMGGERFVEALRSHTEFNRTSIVVLTGDESARTRLWEAGIDVLLKPSDPKVLIATVQKYRPAN